MGVDSCSRSFLQCDNPCNTAPGSCLLLPTQIDTFTTQFFGEELTKAVDSNNQIVWQLPCGLATGLATNARLPGESLACYFLRLLGAGIPGIVGPEGAVGTAGLAGQDAFTVIETAFDQPTLQAPYVAVKIKPVPFIIARLYLLVNGSGVYQILDLEEDGNAVLQLLSPFATPPTEVQPGTIAIVTGFPGVRVIGPQGPRGGLGPAGVQGTVGPTGLTGATGPQGQTGVVFIEQKPPDQGGQLIQITGAYAAYPQFIQSWITPDASLATYLLIASGQLSFFNDNGSPSSSGSLFVKVSTFSFPGFGFIADVACSERVFSVVSDPNLFNSSNFVIPFLFTNTTGQQVYINYQAKTSMTGNGNMQSFLSVPKFYLTGIKLA